MRQNLTLQQSQQFAILTILTLFDRRITMAEKGDHSAGAGEEEEEVEEVADSPDVFQCQNCREILADSLAMKDPLTGPKACIEMSYISFTAVSETVTVGKTITHSEKQTDRDYGCSYLPLSCAGCGAEIGVMYRGTHSEFDALRDLYTIDINKVTTYSLGSGIPKCSLGGIVSAQEKIDNGLAKIRHVLMTLSKRLSVLEQAMMEEEEPDTKENLTPAPRVKHEVKNERPSGTPSRGNKSSQRPSQSSYGSPVPARTHVRKKARIQLSDYESD
ncbi:protein Mis18-alpha-like [Branchiostoma floridae]|uniref:Protein Mis18-alpha-like n=1 Tax=Branchiostoma floridae TaxID=7739 RepID=A0A9J7N0E1_BRAFL|nr:protein Mis18-alpha-like [Branchiostoma floridae]XP_035686707.1 protein Mis18-alpha-like [Branchiostoma floridae]